MKGFLKTYRIDGKEGYDQIAFIDYIRPKVIRFLSEKKKPFQVKFILTCRFRKGFQMPKRWYIILDTFIQVSKR